MLLEFAGKRILLPGDLEGTALKQFMHSHRLMADIAMAPHHGSAEGSPNQFAKWASVNYLVVSGKRWDSIPDWSLALGETRLLHTAKHGAVMVDLSASDARVHSFVVDGASSQK